MKTLFCSLLIYCFSQPLPAQHFTGIIQYISSSISEGNYDTLTYLFDTNMVVKSLPPGSFNRNGQCYSIFMLSYGVEYFFDNHKREVIRINSFPSTVQQHQRLDSLGTEGLLGYTCKIFKCPLKSSHEIIKSKRQTTFWISDKLSFSLPANCTISNKIFANGTGKIALKVVEVGDLEISAIGYSGTQDATMKAIHISSDLPEEFRIVVANFTKWFSN